MPPCIRDLLQFDGIPHPEIAVMLQPNPLHQLNAARQSVWYDPIQRLMLTSGLLARLIAELEQDSRSRARPAGCTVGT